MTGASAGAEAVEPEPPPRPQRLRRWPLALAFLVAVGLAAGLSLWFAARLTDRVDFRTDVVGYPIHQAYNPNRVHDQYLLAVAGFPGLALVLYLALAWTLGRFRLAAPWARAAPRPEREIGRPELGVIGVTFAIGAAFAVEVTLATTSRRLGLVTLLAYCAAVTVAAMLRRRGRLSGWQLAAAINVFAAPWLLVALAGVSAVSGVTDVATGAVVHYAWLPWWLALLLGAASLPLYRRAGDPVAGFDLAYRYAVYVAGPVLLFLILTGLPGALGGMDMFHEGEFLVPARLYEAGYLPWRDLLSTHGPLADGLFPLLGEAVFGGTRWGAAAGMVALLNPLYFVTLYLLAARLVERSWPLVVLSGLGLVAIAQRPLFAGYVLLPERFIFWPPILLLLAAVLARPSRLLAGLLGVTLALQAVLTPETFYCVAACGLVVPLYELTQGEGRLLFGRLPRTLWAAGGGAAVLGAFAIALLATGALGTYVFFFTITAPQHALTGAFPIRTEDWDRTAKVALYAPPAALLLFAWFAASRALRRRRLDVVDWVAGALAVFTVLYYPKFLDRPDPPHLWEAVTPTLPLLAWAAYRALGHLESLPARWLPDLARVPVLARPLSVLLLVAALLAAGDRALVPAISADRLRPQVAVDATSPLLGYGSGALDRDTFEDLSRILSAYLGPGDTVFDFSNQPGLYYYLLQRDPGTRYYHVSIAIPEAAQDDLIAQLKRKPPKLVVFTDRVYGLPSWDGIPNMVRHYDVSQWILDNYVPLLSSHTELFYAERGSGLSAATAQRLPLHEPVLTSGLPFTGATSCDWAYAPNFLAVSPPHRDGATAPATLRLTSLLTPTPGLVIDRLEAPPEGWAAYRWLEIDSADAFAADRWTLTDRLGAGTERAVTFDTMASSPRSYRVYAGSCLQWHGYSATAALYLEHGPTQSITAVRLLP